MFPLEMAITNSVQLSHLMLLYVHIGTQSYMDHSGTISGSDLYVNIYPQTMVLYCMSIISKGI